MQTYLDDMIREFLDNIVPNMRTLESETDRAILLAGFINKWLQKLSLGEVRIVRGLAVEFYTGAALRTVDVDLAIVGGREAEKLVKEFLQRVGGGRVGRVYPLTAIMSKAVDIVPESPIKRRYVEITILGYTAKILSPEDTLIYALNAWKWWNSGEDEVRAKVLAEVLKGRLDIEYLCKRAAEEDVMDKLSEVGIRCGRD